jgi:hypothetical protein
MTRNETRSERISRIRQEATKPDVLLCIEDTDIGVGDVKFLLNCLDQLSDGPQPVKPGPQPVKPGIYEHFKGQRYMVLGVAIHSETDGAFVVYRPLYGDYHLVIRPLAMFTEDIERDGYKGPRFKLVHEL